MGNAGKNADVFLSKELSPDIRLKCESMYKSAPAVLNEKWLGKSMMSSTWIS